MTNSQTTAIEYLKTEIMRIYGHSSDYEYKELEITEQDWGVVTFCAIVGRKGDEGTMAMFVRTRVQIFVGKRGGFYSYNNEGKRVTGFHALLGHRS